MSTQPIDYAALAKQAGAISSVPPPAAGKIDYEKLAKESGAIGYEPPPASDHVISNQPAVGTLPWLKSKVYQAVDATANALPAAGATIGGILGLPEGGPIGAVGGAGIGGMAGSAGKHLLRRAAGFEESNNPGEVAKDITKEGAIQGTIQGASEGLPFLARPLQKAALGQYDRALAASTKPTKAIARKIEPEMMSRNIHGSLESIENQAGQQAAAVKPDLDAAIEAIPEKELNAFLDKYNVPAVPGGTTADIKTALAAKRAHQQAGSMASTVPARITGQTNQIVDSIGSQAQTIPDSVFGPRQSTKLTVETTGPTHGAGKQILDSLENLKQSYIVDGKAADPQAVNAISGVQDIVSQYGNNISAKSLRKLRQIFDNPVAAKGGFAGADLSTAYALQAKRQAANSIREILAQASPDVAALNKEISFWLNVQKVAGASSLRRTGQEGGLLRTLAPLGASAAGAAGLAGQGAHQSIEAATAAFLATHAAMAMRSPAWRTASAIIKDRFADALASGNVGKVLALSARFGVAAPGVIQENAQSDQKPQP